MLIIESSWDPEENEYSERLHARDATYHTTAVLVGAVRAWVDVATVEVQAVRVVAIVRTRRPIAPVRATTVHRRTIHVAGINEVIWVAPKVIASCSASISATKNIIEGIKLTSSIASR